MSKFLPILGLTLFTLSACKDAGTQDTQDSSAATATGTVPELFEPSLFASDPVEVDCTLDNGSSTRCYQLSFSNYQDSSGPFCPETIDDVGGVGIYKIGRASCRERV